MISLTLKSSYQFPDIYIKLFTEALLLVLVYILSTRLLAFNKKLKQFLAHFVVTLFVCMYVYMMR